MEAVAHGIGSQHTNALDVLLEEISRRPHHRYGMHVYGNDFGLVKSGLRLPPNVEYVIGPQMRRCEGGRCHAFPLGPEYLWRTHGHNGPALAAWLDTAMVDDDGRANVDARRHLPRLAARLDVLEPRRRPVERPPRGRRRRRPLPVLLLEVRVKVAVIPLLLEHPANRRSLIRSQLWKKARKDGCMTPWQQAKAFSIIAQVKKKKNNLQM